MPWFLVSYRGEADARVRAELARGGITHVPDEDAPDVQTSRVEAATWQEAGQRLGTSLDFLVVDYTNLAVTNACDRAAPAHRRSASGTPRA